MKSIHIRCCAVAALCLLRAGSPAALAESPSRASSPAEQQARATVQAFYRFHFTHGMSLSTANIRMRQQWFHPSLYKLLLYEMKREAAYTRTHRDEPPYFEGDPFTDSQEYPDTFKIKSVSTNENSVDVSVVFQWFESKRSRKVVDEKSITVKLERVGRSWLIFDILEGDGKSLRSELSRKDYASGG